MAQSLTYPIRYGIPGGNESIKSTEVFAEGGLDLTQSIIEDRPGCASNLVNFEVSLTGGYRRISGYTKYSTTIVPGTGQVLGVYVFWPNTILAARRNASDTTKYDLYHGGGTSWTRINPIASTTTGTTHTTNIITAIAANTNTLAVGQPVAGADIPANTVITSIDSISQIHISNAATGSNSGETLTFAHPLNYISGMVVNFIHYNWTGTNVTTITDGVNPAMKWNGTIFTIINTTGAPANPEFAVEYQGYLFLSGYSSNFGGVTCSAPLNDTDYTALDGAAEIIIGDTVSWLRVWRSQLIIFCKNAIHEITGNSSDPNSASPFTLTHITNNIGCLEGRTVKEIDGDLVFLSPDGIRTISGTFNIGDTEIASISRPIQNIVSTINPVATPCHALVIAKKTQYRLFYPTPSSTSDTNNAGIIGAIRRFRDGHEAWEWGELSGIKPSCCDSGYLSDDQEYVIHGGYDGYVYRQEQGNSFNGDPINEVYTTVPLELGDYGLRKVVHRVTVYVSIEGSSPTLYLKLIYDYGKPGIVQPEAIELIDIGGTSVKYDSGIEYDTGQLYDTVGDPVYRQGVQGSGFVLQLRINSTTNILSSYVVQGYYVEFYPAGRR